MRRAIPLPGWRKPRKRPHVFHAGTKLGEKGEILTSGGRVLGVTARADTLPQAIAAAYEAAEKISFTDMHMRRDIGQRALAALQ